MLKVILFTLLSSTIIVLVLLGIMFLMESYINTLPDKSPIKIWWRDNVLGIIEDED